MKKISITLFLLFTFGNLFAKPLSNFYPGNHPFIKYTGRVDFSDSTKPKFWASGAYLQITFSGTYCNLQIDDEMLWGSVLNYLQIKVDNQPAYRIQLKGKHNMISLAKNLPKGKHTILICKNTEAENGYLQILGFECEKILPTVVNQKRKMEFIGDSITCGAGSDESVTKCEQGEWHDQHNAYLAYGPTTARNLDAQWHLSAVSGIGLMHSCCNKKIVMPQVFDKLNMAKDTIAWDFSLYQPDAVTVCLGQNDGVQDSAKFVGAYLAFAKSLRLHYPKAKLIFLSSPMASPDLRNVMINYITAVKENLNQNGEKNIATYFFSKSYNQGCGGHPSLADHQQIATELTAQLKRIMKW
jgi:lysophospholipase L1-like esterase